MYCFEKKVRRWGEKRGIDKADFQTQYQRFLQEAVEIHDAQNKNDQKELIDALGDTIVTLVGLAAIAGTDLKICVDQAFEVIERRKGINKSGSFVRYGKLSKDDQLICDEKQGNPGNEYFKAGATLEPKDFLKD